ALVAARVPHPPTLPPPPPLLARAPRISSGPPVPERVPLLPHFYASAPLLGRGSRISSGTPVLERVPHSPSFASPRRRRARLPHFSSDTFPVLVRSSPRISLITRCGSRGPSWFAPPRLTSRRGSRVARSVSPDP